MKLAIAVSVAIALCACASPPPRTIAAPTPAERAAAEQAGFEVGPVRHSRDLLPPELLSGPHHQVRDEVINDGQANVYSISSEFGDIEARGDDRLRVRVREIEALAAMDAMSKTAEFASAAGRALASPFVATWNLITNPVDSIRGVPVGAWEAIRRTATLARNERSEFEDSGLASFIGFETKKREIAVELGVDPYSSNEALQTQLNRFAWAAYAGSLPSMFVPFTKKEPAPESQNRIEAVLIEYSPEDLGRLNRIELAVMGISGPLADGLIGHRWYSPRQETLLVDALSRLGLADDRAAFVEVAIGADDEDDALSFVQTAVLLRDYSEQISPIVRIVAVDTALMGYSEDHTLLLPLPADHAVWTPSLAALCQSAEGAAEDGLPEPLAAERTAMVVSGTLSPLARDRMSAMGIEISERAFDPSRASSSAPDLP